jgi:hypothetical protein
MSERWGDPPDEFEPWQFQFQLGTLLVAVFFLALLAAIWRMSALAGLAATGALLGLATNAVRGANSAKWLAIGALSGLLIAGAIGALAMIPTMFSNWGGR